MPDTAYGLVKALMAELAPILASIKKRFRDNELRYRAIEDRLKELEGGK